MHIDISIIMATRNRQQILWESIEKARAAIENKNAEIIVINDGEPFNPPVMPAGIPIRFLENGGRGVSVARNFGAKEAQGSILFFIDDDMWINKEVIDWIQVNMIDTKRAGAVYNINWEYPQSLKSKLTGSKIGRYIISSGYQTMWGRMHEKGAQPEKGLYVFHTIASCSLVLDKELFNKLGGYKESISFQGEDIDLSNRLNNLSIPIIAVFDTTLFHNQQDRLEIEGFLDRLRNGYGSEFKAVKAGFIKAHSDRSYEGMNKALFEIFRLTDWLWMGLYKLIPNHPAFKSLTNRLIGLLAGLERYKEWRKVFKDN